MMHTVSAAFEAAIAQGRVRMCELVDLELANGTTYRYTNHDNDITWNAAGDTYSALLPGDYRGPISYHTDGAFDTVDLSMGLIDSGFQDTIINNILEAARITIRLIRWDASYATDEEIVLFVGEADPNYNANELRIRLTTEIDSLNILVPRDIYQPGCNRRLFDSHCGLSRDDYAYSGTATGGTQTTLIDATAAALYKASFDNGDSGNPIEIGDSLSGGSGGDGVCINIVYLTSSTGYIWYVENTQQFVDDEVITGGGNTVTVNGTPAADTSFYEKGEIEMLTGDNAGECRPILSDNSSTRTVLWPFVSAIANGDTYKIWPGCDGQAATHVNKFGGNNKWRGFPYVPLAEEMLT